MMGDLVADRQLLSDRSLAVAEGFVSAISPAVDCVYNLTAFRGIDRSLDWEHGGKLLRGHSGDFNHSGLSNRTVEHLRRGEKYYVGRGNRQRESGYVLFKDPYFGATAPSEKRHTFDPFSDFLLASGGLHASVDEGYGSKLESLLFHLELKEISRGLGGTISGVWTYDGSPVRRTEVKMTFDPKYDLRPTETQTRFIYDDYELSARTSIRWKKYKEYWLPVWWTGTESMNPSDRTETIEATFKVYWLVGDEVPDEYFEAEDPFQWVLDRFKIPDDRVVDGRRVPEQYAPDADLPTYRGEQWQPGYFAKWRTKDLSAVRKVNPPPRDPLDAYWMPQKFPTEEQEKPKR